jgi:hypothetical protein
MANRFLVKPEMREKLTVETTFLQALPDCSINSSLTMSNLGQLALAIAQKSSPSTGRIIASRL